METSCTQVYVYIVLTHMMMPYIKSDHWSIKVSITYSSKSSPQSQIEVCHITYVLINPLPLYVKLLKTEPGSSGFQADALHLSCSPSCQFNAICPHKVARSSLPPPISPLLLFISSVQFYPVLLPRSSGQETLFYLPHFIPTAQHFIPTVLPAPSLITMLHC